MRQTAAPASAGAARPFFFAIRRSPPRKTGRAGIHRTYLSDIERGTRDVSLINIEWVGRVLLLSISELFQAVYP